MLNDLEFSLDEENSLHNCILGTITTHDDKKVAAHQNLCWCCGCTAFFILGVLFAIPFITTDITIMVPTMVLVGGCGIIICHCFFRAAYFVVVENNHFILTSDTLSVASSQEIDEDEYQEINLDQ